MDEVQTAIDLSRQALFVALAVALPVLLTGLVVGVFVSIIQAATQIQEQTLSFIPKILAMMAALYLFLPFVYMTLGRFAANLLERLPEIIRLGG